MTYLLLYSHDHDPIVESLSRNPTILSDTLISLSVNDLLNQTTITDTIINGVPTLNWRLKAGQSITNSPQTCLINRVLGIPPTLFESFHPDDREYALQEFYAYLSFAAEAFPNKTATPNFFGISGGQYPLPYQWQKIESICSNVNTPEYYYGPPQHCPFNLSSDTVIHGNLYSYYEWKPVTEARVGENGQIFVYSRPPGTPCIAICIGDQCLIQPHGHSQLPLAPIVIDQIQELAFTINKAFDRTISEFLFFVNHHEIAFGMTSVQMRSHTFFDDFAKHVARGIFNYFKEAPC